MKFYNRNTEIVELRKLSHKAHSGRGGLMTIVVGRRRVGKTRLLREVYQGHNNFLYLFTAKKPEPLLCEEFTALIKHQLNIPIFGQIQHFRDIFLLLLEASKQQAITVVIDEFQAWHHINPSIFSEIQNLWDQYKEDVKLHLIVCGSVYSLMTRIFEHSKEPLFGRVDQKIHLKPLQTDYLREFLIDNQHYSAENLLTIKTLIGGVPKYLEQLSIAETFDLNSILDKFIVENSFFMEEGKHLLIEEFGRDYMNYFAILELISVGKTSRREIESILQKSVGNYIERLERDYCLITRHRPIFAKPNSRQLKYSVKDNFLRFWFYFIHRYQSTTEIGNYKYIKQIIKRDFNTFTGKILEQIFREQLMASQEFSQIGAYWEKNNENEVDIVAVNELEKTILIAEVKRQASKINLNLLKKKSQKIRQKMSNYTIQFKGFSLEDLENVKHHN
jgi:AAA+ ATPase superfamily predicted ATPase